jgi:hypothetical protein
LILGSLQSSQRVVDDGVQRSCSWQKKENFDRNFIV